MPKDQMIDNSDLQFINKANILIEALPYIQRLWGKTIVIKYGGNAMINEELKAAVMGDIVLLSLIGIKVVLIHGGGPEISEMLDKIGKKSEFVNGLRVTDAESMDIVQQVLTGKVNKNLVNLLNGIGGKAIGLCGIDGHMIKAKQMDPALGFVGEVTKIDPQPILDVLEKGYIPVIATVGCDAEGNSYNINADTAAARIASALKAESLISMTDISGILRDKDDPETLIPVVHVSEAPQLIREGIISGGMIPTFLVIKELDLLNTIWSIVLPGAVSTYNMILMRTFFLAIPSSLVEAAELDGCSDFGVLIRIVLPLSMASLMTIGMFYAVGHWNSYFSAVLYLNKPELYPLQIILRQVVLMNEIVENASSTQVNMAEGIKYATIVVAMLPMLCIYPFVQRYFVKGVMIGSVKE